MSAPRPAAAAPLIARVAGLPADVLEPFSTRLGDLLEARWREESLLGDARAALVDRLHDAVPGADPALRRVLLAAKRDCHNGRPLRADEGTRSAVAGVAGAELARVLEAERRADEAARAYAAAYEEEARGQIRRVGAIMDEPLFHVGVGVASPLVAREAARLRDGAAETRGRREERLAETVLRYASRAALKLSPFSTFTHVGVARVEEGDAPPALADGWTPRSLVRIRRHLLDRCFELLRRYPPVRARLGVARNDSVTPLEDGRILFQRPGHYRVDEVAEGERKLAYFEESLVRVRLRGPVADSLGELLAGGPLPHGELVPRLARSLGGEVTEEAAAGEVDRLVEVGLLHLLPPWEVDDGHAEKTLLHWLAALPADARLEAFVDELRTLLRLQEGLLEAAHPGDDLREMHRMVAALIQRAAGLAGIPEDVNVVGKEWDHEVYQDVWCDPHGGGEAVVTVGRAPLDEALRSVAPVVRFTRLFDPHLDFLHTLGGLLRERAPGRDRVPFMEALQLAQPLWQEFMRHRMAARRVDGGWRTTWNPRGLPALDELARWRDEVWSGFPGTMADGPEGRRVSVEAMEALLAPVPARWTEDLAGACLFLQPASADGSLWMLNRVKEGTGRFASRYTPLMEPALRRRYGAELAARGARTADGERAQLLDVQCVQGDTLNVHAPQTPEVLVMPGTVIDLPRERQRRLGDLWIALGGDDWPTVRDGDGTRYLPVHLGVGYIDYMPTLAKFLCAFGPTELGAVFPPPLVRREGAGWVQERTTIGSVVLHRRAWTVPTADLRALLEGAGGAEAFAALHRWRRERGLPDRVFAIERTPHPIAKFTTKPQYLDLTSPLFASVLRSILDDAGDTLQLVEMLPSAELFPRGPGGRPRAVELLVDSLALAPAGDPPAASDAGAGWSDPRSAAPELVRADGGG